jgi:hypothetical protein
MGGGVHLLISVSRVDHFSLIILRAEDVAAIDYADDHVFEQVGNIEAGGFWHDGNIAAEEGLIN